MPHRGTKRRLVGVPLALCFTPIAPLNPLFCSRNHLHLLLLLPGISNHITVIVWIISRVYVIYHRSNHTFTLHGIIIAFPASRFILMQSFSCYCFYSNSSLTCTNNDHVLCIRTFQRSLGDPKVQK